MKKYERLHWVLWHPHQKLWNRRLVKGLRVLPAGRHLAAAVVLIDSMLLWVIVIVRRAKKLGLPALWRNPHLPRRALYIDCGVHRDGRQIRMMSQWFGNELSLDIVAFEASADHFASAQSSLSDIPNLDLRHAAVVGNEHDEPTVRLYKAGGDGRGDSLFSQRGTTFEEVPATRLSDVVRDHGGVPILLRMNIEGAELFVVQDLVSARQVSRIVGFYGMWDDLSKISPTQDDKFRHTLRNQSIHPITFNDRDLDIPLRVRAIHYDLQTSLASALAR